MTTTDIRTGQSTRDTHRASAGADPNPPPATVAATPKADPPVEPNVPDGQNTTDAHAGGAVRDPHSRPGQGVRDTHGTTAGAGPASRPTSQYATPIATPSAGTPTSGDHHSLDTHRRDVAAPTPPAPVSRDPMPNVDASVLAGTTPDPTSHEAPPIWSSSGRDQAGDDRSSTGAQTRSVVAPDLPGPANDRTSAKAAPLVLADPLLALAADVLDDLERVRIANENRLRQLTRSVDETDKDGRTRGFGLTVDFPDVQRLAAMVRAMRCDSKVVVDLLGKQPKKAGCCLEHDAEKQLTAQLKRHPLGPWVKATKGVGDKQGARMLAAIGDPYIRPGFEREDGTVEPSRPRLVSELWSYCGYGDAVKQVRRRGEKARWSSTAKMRTFVIAESCLKQLTAPCHAVKNEAGEYMGAAHVEDCACSPYRVIWDQGREKYFGTVHPRDCVRCGPSGKPKPAGSPRSAKHQQACATRLVSKAILRDLWREAKRLHDAAAEVPQ